MGLNALIGHNILCSVTTHAFLLNKKLVTSKLDKIWRYSLVILIASALLVYEAAGIPKSYYNNLGLRIHARQYEIAREYKKFRDNLNRTDNIDNRIEIKKAFEVLSNDESRALYDHFGDIEYESLSSTTLAIVVTSLALSFQVLSCILSCTLNSSKKLKISRYVAILYAAISFALEIESRFVQGTSHFHGIYYIENLLPFQLCQLMRAIAPSITLFANAISTAICVDKDYANYLLWKSAVSTNGVIVEKMGEVVEAANYIKSCDIPTGNSASGTWSIVEGQDILKNEEVKEIISSMDDESRQKLIALLTSQGKGKSKGKGWFEMIKSPLIYLTIFLIVHYLRL